MNARYYTPFIHGAIMKGGKWRPSGGALAAAAISAAALATTIPTTILTATLTATTTATLTTILTATLTKRHGVRGYLPCVDQAGPSRAARRQERAVQPHAPAW